MRKNSLARQVRRAYRQHELARVCTLREDRFGRAFGMETVSVAQHMPSWSRNRSDRSEDYYHFRDNGSSVLAVAHLDTVVSQAGRVPHFRSTEKGPLITSGALDDRLGAYVITGLLPKLGIACDWLFTVGEESSASTAEFFDAGGKKYDHVIEFDRGGTDVVMYQYEDDATSLLVEAAGADVGWGSFSDIAYLEHLGVKAFNWGVGYRGNYHSEAGYAYLNDTFAMVAQYLRFHEQNAGMRLPHEPRKPGKSPQSYNYYDKYDEDYYGDCTSCGEKNTVDSVTWYCTFCGVCQDCGGTDPDVAAEWNDPDVDICQCYAPKHARDEAAQAGSQVISVTTTRDEDRKQLTWSDYLSQRPADAEDEDEDEDEDAYQAGKQAGENALSRSPRISAAPPWSEHRPVSHGLGFPTGRNDADRDMGGGAHWNREAGPGAARAAGQRAGAVELAASLGYPPSSVSPAPVFPDADLGWHAAAKGRSGDYLIAHQPGQCWASDCLRCAARWPHPVSGSTDIHPESDCPGCSTCDGIRAADPVQRTAGFLHIIPAHLAGESHLCGACRQRSDALSEFDRGQAAGRAALRALDG